MEASVTCSMLRWSMRWDWHSLTAPVPEKQHFNMFQVRYIPDHPNTFLTALDSKQFRWQPHLSWYGRRPWTGQEWIRSARGSGTWSNIVQNHWIIEKELKSDLYKLDCNFWIWEWYVWKYRTFIKHPSFWICSSWSGCSTCSSCSSRALLQGDARSGCPGDSANAQAMHGQGDTRPRSRGPDGICLWWELCLCKLDDGEAGKNLAQTWRTSRCLSTRLDLPSPTGLQSMPIFEWPSLNGHIFEWQLPRNTRLSKEIKTREASKYSGRPTKD